MLPYAIYLIYKKIKKGANYLGFIFMHLSFDFYTEILAFFLLTQKFLVGLIHCLKFIEFLRLINCKLADFLYLRISFNISY